MNSCSMKLEEMKEKTFTPYSIEEWASKAEESLKGRKIESLSTSTYENIVLKPLYSRDDIETASLSQFPGFANYSRGIAAKGYQGKAWFVANKIPYNNMEELETKLNAAFSAGQNAFAIEVKENLFSNEEKLEQVLQQYSSEAPFCVYAKEYLESFLNTVTNAVSDHKDKVTGFIASDIIADAAANGGFRQEDDEAFKQWGQVIQSAHHTLPNVRTVLIDTSIYHNSGANAVQELGIAIATGVNYVQSLLDQGWDLEQAMGKLVFHFSIGANFFMETAKLRAARLLWDKAMEAYSAPEELRKMEISAETSKFTKTVFDPYVNLLRAGNEAFSAVLGGVQYLSVSPLDEAIGETTAFSERIARNTQLILQSEAQLEKVADPAGGSWYIETLTKELAEKAWEYFLTIEEQGGIVATLKSNWLQDQISEVRASRDEDVFSRKQSIIGTNVYANVVEETKQVKTTDKTTASGAFASILETRLAEPYEQLRLKALEIEKQVGKKPSVGLVCLGELKKHKPRADFITGFLAAGGIEVVQSGEVNDVQAAIDFIQATNVTHYCICGDQRQYDENLLNFVKEIIVNFPQIKISMAGIPDESLREAYKEAGIQEYWHVKSNNYEILSRLMKELEVSIDE